MHRLLFKLSANWKDKKEKQVIKNRRSKKKEKQQKRSL